MRTHICDELISVEKRNPDTEISITKIGDEDWNIYLFDGDGIGTEVNYCPYCGEKLIK